MLGFVFFLKLIYDWCESLYFPFKIGDWGEKDNVQSSDLQRCLLNRLLKAPYQGSKDNKKIFHTLICLEYEISKESQN